MDHKAWCNCSHCTEGRKLQRSLRGNRKLPGFVMHQFIQKKMSEEQAMLDAGMILMECPHCKHTSYMKIQPVMKCTLCCQSIS
jgi:hypothetical protein